jgi:hypothetical protein
MTESAKPYYEYQRIRTATEIHVPPFYRPFRRTHCNAILRKFDPLHLGTISLSYREEEKRLAWLDGLHRFTAARERDIEEVPAQVFFRLTYPQEATIYWRFASRKNQSAFDRFIARVEAEDPTALEIVDCLESYGLRVDRRGAYGSISAVYALDTIHQRGAHVFADTIRLLYEAFAGDSLAYNQYSLQGTAAFVAQYTPPTLKWGELVRKLQKYGVQAVTQEATVLRTSLSASTNSWGRALWAIYNKGRRSGRLPEWRDHVPDTRVMAASTREANGKAVPLAASPRDL